MSTANSGLLDHVHSSSYWGFVSKFLDADVDNFRAMGASIFTTTEISHLTVAEQNTIFKDKGFGFYTGPNVAGQDECGINWDELVWNVMVDGKVIELADKQYWQKNGDKFPKFHCIKITLGHKPSGNSVTFFVVHMPLLDTDLRAEIWSLCAAELVKQIKATTGYVVVAADWNLGYRLNETRAKLNREILNKLSKTFHWAWENNVPRTSKRLIDGMLTNVPVLDCDLLPKVPSQDEAHRPVRMKAQLPLIEKTTNKAGQTNVEILRHNVVTEIKHGQLVIPKTRTEAHKWMREGLAWADKGPKK